MVDPMEMILGEQLGLKTIAISSDRSTTNQMVANRQGVNLWPLEKMDKNHPIVLPMDTSVEYAIRICMKTHGYKMEDVSLIDIPQDTCAAEMMGDNPKANFGGFQVRNSMDQFSLSYYIPPSKPFLVSLHVRLVGKLFGLRSDLFGSVRV